MSTTGGAPCIVSPTAPHEPLQRLDLAGGQQDDYDEKWLQSQLFRAPSLIPVEEIDPGYEGLVPVCRELKTEAGFIDLLYVTAKGKLAIVEAKLWRNPEARRKVVAQILDYAAEISRWTYEDLQREVGRQTGRSGNVLYDLVAATTPSLDERAFCDAVARNLRLGEFLLVIVGDGIREGTRQIAEFLVEKNALNFSLGLLEVQVWRLPDSRRLIVPRVQARTELIRRVILVPAGTRDADEEDETEEAAVGEDPGRLLERRDTSEQFWKDVLADLRLDDQTQPMAKPRKGSNINFPGPPDSQTSIKVWYASQRNDRVGVYLRVKRSAISSEIVAALRDQLKDIEAELDHILTITDDGAAVSFAAREHYADVLGRNRDDALAYLRRTTNAFVNAFRHRVRKACGDVRAA